MSEGQSQPTGPDLSQGVAIDSVADGGMVAGHVGDDAVLLARRGDEFFAIGATCTHYNGPLAEGVVDGDVVRCPWHHACFSLRTGEALHAPAFSPVSCWRVERSGGRVYVREKLEPSEKTQPATARPATTSPQQIVLLGGGAAGFAAAEMLRRESFGGKVVMLSADESAPYDRPNLSKDYLSGNAPEEWIPLRGPEFYQENG